MGFRHHHHHGHDHHEHGHGSGVPPVPGGAGPAPGAPAPGGGRAEVGRRLGWVLGLTALFTVVEVVGGFVSGSLALLADAGHMFSDVAALALSLFAIRLARRPPTERRTYGYARFEILAALVNGSTLLVVSGFIVYEAWERVRTPVAIDAPVMLGVAGLGLLVNVLAASVLHGHAHDNLNVRGAYLHVLGDLLGSVGTIAAGLVVLLTGWAPADPIISVFIAALVLYSAWNLVREATDVLLESVPGHLDLAEIIAALETVEGLDDVHDVHVWTLTSGFVALSGHGVIDDAAEHMRILDEVRERMRAFGIEHVTFQIEPRPLYQLVRESR